MIQVVIGEGLLIIVGIISTIFWHKKIDPHTTFIYGIYVVVILILWLFVLIGLQQYYG